LLSRPGDPRDDLARQPEQGVLPEPDQLRALALESGLRAGGRQHRSGGGGGIAHDATTSVAIDPLPQLGGFTDSSVGSGMTAELTQPVQGAAHAGPRRGAARHASQDRRRSCQSPASSAHPNPKRNTRRAPSWAQASKAMNAQVSARKPTTPNSSLRSRPGQSASSSPAELREHGFVGQAAAVGEVPVGEHPRCGADLLDLGRPTLWGRGVGSLRHPGRLSSARAAARSPSVGGPIGSSAHHRSSNLRSLDVRP
jgi:hypothetical protein